jgi:hypothetical protein
VPRQGRGNGPPNAQVAYRAMDQHHSLAAAAVGASNSPPGCFHIFRTSNTSSGTHKHEPQQQMRPLTSMRVNSVSN